MFNHIVEVYNSHENCISPCIGWSSIISLNFTILMRTVSVFEYIELHLAHSNLQDSLLPYFSLRSMDLEAERIVVSGSTRLMKFTILMRTVSIVNFIEPQLACWTLQFSWELYPFYFWLNIIELIELFMRIVSVNRNIVKRSRQYFLNCI